MQSHIYKVYAGQGCRWAKPRLKTTTGTVTALSNGPNQGAGQHTNTLYQYRHHLEQNEPKHKTTVKDFTGQRKGILSSTYHKGQVLQSTYHKDQVLWSTYHKGQVLQSTYHKGQVSPSTYHKGQVLQCTYHKGQVLPSTYHKGHALPSTYYKGQVLQSTYQKGVNHVIVGVKAGSDRWLAM